MELSAIIGPDESLTACNLSCSVFVQSFIYVERHTQPSQNQAVVGSLSRLLEMFDLLLSKGPIAFSCIQESLSLLLPTNNLLFKIFLRRLHTIAGY